MAGTTKLLGGGSEAVASCENWRACWNSTVSRKGFIHICAWLSLRARRRMMIWYRDFLSLSIGLITLYIGYGTCSDWQAYLWAGWNHDQILSTALIGFAYLQAFVVCSGWMTGAKSQ
jgi:hypothetical protein